MKSIEIAGHSIKPGSRTTLSIPLARLYTDHEINMSVHVRRARSDGPTVFVAAAIHGDELNGIEIVRRLINSKRFRLTAGTVILVPMVNIYGVVHKSRYMPDRRDLNRSFPGSETGSLASSVAHRFMQDIVSQCDYGIDLHTGAVHRSNLPQIRADLSDATTRRLAEAFGVSVLLNSNLRDGSLRQAGHETDTRILLFEGGEALRFDEFSIRAGVRGIINVLSELKMASTPVRKRVSVPYVANTSAWIRANHSGFVKNRCRLGDHVLKGDVLAEIGDPLGATLGIVQAKQDGIVIGRQNIPLVQTGDAMFHIAYFSEQEEEIASNIQAMHEFLLPSESNEPT